MRGVRLRPLATISQGRYYSSHLIKLEPTFVNSNVQTEVGREFLAHKNPAHAVALRIQPRGIHADAKLPVHHAENTAANPRSSPGRRLREPSRQRNRRPR